MKKTKTFWAIAALVLAVLLIFSGCKKKSGASGATTAGTKTPITFTFYNQDGSDQTAWTDPVATEITKRTGVSLKIDYPVSGDLQVIPLMIASGELPDLIFAKGDLTMLIDAGLVIQLDSLIESRGNYIKQLYGPMLNRLRNSVDDPHIYNVGTYAVYDGKWTPEGAMQIQHAVLKELGYPRMRTLDDYEQAIKAYMRRYPTINGRPTIGFSLLIDTWQWYIDLSNPGFFLLGYPDDGQWLVDQDTLEAYYKFLHPQAPDYFRWLNRMYHEGVLDPESITQTEDEWRAKIASGRVLGIAYPNWGYGEARQSLINDGQPERTFAYPQITYDESIIDKNSMINYGFSGGWGVAITTSCKDPERAFEFLDWLCSEEAQILINWGIEGTNYNVVNGKRVMIESERLASISDPNWGRRTGVGIYSHPFPQYGRGHIDSTGNWITRDSPETIKQNYLDVEVETLAAYGAEMWMDLFAPTSSIPVPRHGQAWQYALPPDLNAKVQEADDYIKTALSNIVIGPQANFDASWQRIVQDLRRMGIEDANREMTRQVRDKVKLWEQ